MSGHCAKQRYVVFDVETTGLSASRGGRIIELGAVAVDESGMNGEFYSLIDPGAAISTMAQRVHGITNDMLIGMPKPDAVLSGFHRFISDSVLVAHNASFDVTFLRYEFSRLGLGFCNSSRCTLALSRKMLRHLGNHRLETVYRCLFGAPPDGSTPHRALDDARMTARVWMELMKR